jgi:O-antigen/teichoic acid export membrane protein
VATGPIGGMMVMSGRERILLYLSVTGLLIAVLLSVVLVPTIGLVGAAIASVAATIFRNIFCYVYMRLTCRPGAAVGSQA